MSQFPSAEHQRLADSEARRADWKRWGPYVSDRAWGTVREDYSANGDAWNHFPHDHARSRAYRWNEDGIGGFCNRFQNICLGLAFWNEHDPILKERFFGLGNTEGNHGEDVKEYYFYLDGTPSHSYMKMLYIYPQVAFPYEKLVQENARRGYHDREFELADAIPDAFEAGRFFETTVEYAKAAQEDLLYRVTAVNRGPEAAPIHLVPHLWYRNTWSWGYNPERPEIRASADDAAYTQQRHIGERWWYSQSSDGQRPTLLFTENETNNQRLFGQPNSSPYSKDGINNAIVAGEHSQVNPDQIGSKAAAHFSAVVAAGDSLTVMGRFSDKAQDDPFEDFDVIFALRRAEADEFYTAIQPGTLDDDQRNVQRQAFAGLLWSKQFYHYGVELWLKGDPASPAPPASRRAGRNVGWSHMYNLDVLSMPDKWEYPWFAAWDLAFHCIPLAMIDAEWAKRQLILLLREWYMRPNGQIPAYEWSFGDVNPPVHAWAAWQVYKIDRDRRGAGDTAFLERIFHKLLLNFTWWVNRKDAHSNNVFEGGFLGLDNIGVFDRNAPLPDGGHIEQADGTAWMGMYCLNMLAIALELARSKPAYEDVATKFFEHFIYIAHAMYNIGAGGDGLWNPQAGFFYDIIHALDEDYQPLAVNSFVGLIPLFAVEIIDAELLKQLPRFERRVQWFIKHRPNLLQKIYSLSAPGEQGSILLAIVGPEKLKLVLKRMLDPAEFLSKYGLRSLSKIHETYPYEHILNGEIHTVAYEPAESRSGLFGGNSNWRGPIWLPLNYLMIETLLKYDHYFGEKLKVELPSGSGERATLNQVARDLSKRLISIFTINARGERPVLDHMETNMKWNKHPLFYEYFHGDTGAGLGASHQTGWTALVAKLIQDCADE